MRLISAFLPALVAALVAGTGASASPRSDPGALDGVYRVSWTEQELLAAGASPADARRNHSVITMTARAGKFVQAWSTPPSCGGVYATRDDSVTFRFTRVCTGWVEAHWTRTPGQLRLHITTASDKITRIQFGGKPWQRVGS